MRILKNLFNFLFRSKRILLKTSLHTVNKKVWKKDGLWMCWGPIVGKVILMENGKVYCSERFVYSWFPIGIWNDEFNSYLNFEQFVYSSYDDI